MPEPLRVSVRAAGRLNPSQSGESLATTVRLYQLKDVSKLQAASHAPGSDTRPLLRFRLVESRVELH
ncbi:MAG: type VI secretion lipoprotein TssJ [Polyangia bacterium]